MKISEMITDRYKMRIPPTVYYDLLADVREAEEEQEPKFIAKSDGTIEQIKNCEDCLYRKEWEKIGKLLSVILEKHTEQEPILDKIRAEITDLRDSWEKDNYHDEADALTWALTIVDKYKTDRSEEE